MGLLGAISGYVCGKTTIAVLSLSLWTGGALATVTGNAPLAIILFDAFEATAALAVAPMDPITLAITETATVASGPI